MLVLWWFASTRTANWGKRDLKKVDPLQKPGLLALFLRFLSSRKLGRGCCLSRRFLTVTELIAAVPLLIIRLLAFLRHPNNLPPSAPSYHSGVATLLSVQNRPIREKDGTVLRAHAFAVHDHSHRRKQAQFLLYLLRNLCKSDGYNQDQKHHQRKNKSNCWRFRNHQVELY